MGLRPCRECQQPVSKRAKLCPHCGARLRRRFGCGCVVMLIFGAFVLMLMLSVLVVAFNPPTNAPNKAPQASNSAKPSLDTYRPVAGDLAELSMGSSSSVLVAPTKEAYNRLTKLGHSNDVQGIDSLIELGVVWKVPAGTPCRVVDAGVLTYEVRILEGAYVDRLAFVVREFVVAPNPRLEREPAVPAATNEEKLNTKSLGSEAAQSIPPGPQVLALLEELDRFRDNADFQTYGFSPGGPYHDWLRRVQAINSDSTTLIHDRLAAGYLQSLGRAYLPNTNRSEAHIAWFRKAVLEGPEAAGVLSG